MSRLPAILRRLWPSSSLVPPAYCEASAAVVAEAQVLELARTELGLELPVEQLRALCASRPARAEETLAELETVLRGVTHEPALAVRLLAALDIHATELEPGGGS